MRIWGTGTGSEIKRCLHANDHLGQVTGVKVTFHSGHFGVLRWTERSLFYMYKLDPEILRKKLT